MHLAQHEIFIKSENVCAIEKIFGGKVGTVDFSIDVVGLHLVEYSRLVDIIDLGISVYPLVVGFLVVNDATIFILDYHHHVELVKVEVYSTVTEVFSGLDTIICVNGSSLAGYKYGPLLSGGLQIDNTTGVEIYVAGHWVEFEELVFGAIGDRIIHLVIPIDVSEDSDIITL